MGFTNLYAEYVRKLVYILLILPIWVHAQTQTTTIPGYLKIKKTTNTVVAKDSALTIDTNGNVKRGVLGGGGGSSTGINGLNGTTTIGLGGTLANHTLITSPGFNLSINQTNSANNILQLQFSASNRFTFDAAGNMHANGIKQLNDPTNGVIDLSGGSISVYRDKADSGGIFTVYQHNVNGVGDIIHLNNTSYAMVALTGDGTLIQTPIAYSRSTVARGYLMQGALKPTANGDTEIGMDVSPTFGTSTITTIGSVVGGSGYPDGTRLSNVSGGTGKQAIVQVVISGGVVQSAVLIDGGVNYTNGDVLSIVITDSSGNPIGSGGTVTVSATASYTGLTQYALRTAGRDVYTSDLSASYGNRDKVDKEYADTHSAGVSLTSTTTAPIPFPKMTTTQRNAIVSPVEGMFVYDTTLHHPFYYNGSAWIQI